MTEELMFALTLIVGMVAGAVIVLSSFMYFLFQKEEDKRLLSYMPPPPYPPYAEPPTDLDYIINKHTNY